MSFGTAHRLPGAHSRHDIAILSYVIMWQICAQAHITGDKINNYETLTDSVNAS